MKSLKIGAVVFGALCITALGIDATDSLSGASGTLLGQLLGPDVQGVCPSGMVEVQAALSFTCVDIYEASAASGCTYPNPQNEQETKANIEDSDCEAMSEANREPWRFITREQAVRACAQAGKRLPKSEEWYLTSVGTKDDAAACNTNSTTITKTGAKESCLSAAKTYDTIGNVWEWMIDDVIDGQLQGRTLPEAGYVTQVDSNGVATLTGKTPSDLFYADYFWSAQKGAFGVLRGGFYGSKSDAGVYSVHAQTAPTSAGTAIGFRCVK
jgi:formylglycine-generating enzyme required for sulfatase activity